MTKLSEACKACRGAIIEYLDTVGIAEQKLKCELANCDLSATDQTQSVNPDKLFWEKQTSEKANQNSDGWRALVAKLKANHGFWQDSGKKYWFHNQDETVIDSR